MKEELLMFIQEKSFPCIMAKAVASKGILRLQELPDLESSQSVETTLASIYDFIEVFRFKSERLSSFALVVPNERYKDFRIFERYFWRFLRELYLRDRQVFAHDPRVGDDPRRDNFSYSLKKEAFFLLALHPSSPRWSRRFKHPTIIFNPHAQFEKLRDKGIFKKIRDLIRHRDQLLQGFANPMLSDFGERSEVFQYLGRSYPQDSLSPLNIQR